MTASEVITGGVDTPLPLVFLRRTRRTAAPPATRKPAGDGRSSGPRITPLYAVDLTRAPARLVAV